MTTRGGHLLLAMIALGALTSCRSVPDESEMVMRVVLQSLAADTTSRFEPDTRRVVLGPHYYPERDSIPIPSSVRRWAKDALGIAPLTEEQVADRAQDIAILTLYPQRTDDGGQIVQPADLLYFVDSGGAFSNDWEFVVRCEQARLGSRACTLVTRSEMGISHYGSNAR